MTSWNIKATSPVTSLLFLYPNHVVKLDSKKLPGPSKTIARVTANGISFTAIPDNRDGRLGLKIKFFVPLSTDKCTLQTPHGQFISLRWTLKKP